MHSLLDCLPEPELRANMHEAAVWVTIPDEWFGCAVIVSSSSVPADN